MNGTLLAAEVETIQTRADGSIKIVVGTQELSPSKAAELIGLRKKLIAIYLSEKPTISDAEIKQVDAIEVEFGGKTPSQRMRNILYLLFSQDAEGFKEFDAYYRSKTEAIIEHLKTKIK